MITDRNGEPLAVSTPVESIWANPQELLAATRTACRNWRRRWACRPTTSSASSSQRADKEFVYLQAAHQPGRGARRSSRSTSPACSRSANSAASTRRARRWRTCSASPTSTTAARKALELAFDDWLRGKPGAKKVIRDRRGRIVENVDLVRAARAGQGPDAQHRPPHPVPGLSRTASSALLETGASSGSAVVLDVATGEVLAMANLPSFNPERGRRRRPRRAPQPRGDRPGRARLDDEADHRRRGARAPAWSRRTRWSTPIRAGSRNGRYRTTDTHNHGVLDITGVITKSSQRRRGARSRAQLQQPACSTTSSAASATARAPAAASPANRPACCRRRRAGAARPSRRCRTATACRVTPLQIAQAYAAIANGGRLIAPTFVKGQRNAGRAR